MASYTRLSSKQNADAISQGYKFMQQFTLPLKASLAQALEKKFGEVLCYLLQLSPSALRSAPALHCPSWQETEIRHHLAPQYGERTTTASSTARGPTHTLCTGHSCCAGLSTLRQPASEQPGLLFAIKKYPIKIRFPLLETHWSSCWWAMLCHHGGVP